MDQMGAVVKFLGQEPFEDTWNKMHSFTQTRTADVKDELWVVEHPAIFTLGQAGKRSHILNAHDIPIIQTDRGGQVTYHGPGQIVIYTLLNLKKLSIGIRTLVSSLESAVIKFLSSKNIDAYAKKEAPGIYINEEKIASIGLRVSRGYTYHGIAINVDMDLKPFNYINPCGYENLKMTQLKTFIPDVSIKNIANKIIHSIQLELYQYNNH